MYIVQLIILNEVGPFGKY